MDLYRQQITPWHKKIIAEWDLSKYKILWAGRKARKTTFDINELFFHAMQDTKGLTYPFIAPTRTQAKKIVWDDHVNKLLNLCKENEVPYKINNTELTVKFPGYGTVAIDGSDNIEALRGKSDWGGVVMDEFSVWKNKKIAWEEVIEPNLLVHNAWAIISGTPKGFEYHHMLMKLGDHAGMIEGDAFDEDGKIVKPHKNFRAYRYTSYDNPFLDHEWVDDKKERLTQATFNQEYLARAEKFTGLIYKDFTRDTHIIEPFNVPTGEIIHAGMDFGATNPTVYLWIYLDRDDNVYVIDEYYDNGQTTPAHADMIKAKSQNKMMGTTWGDPSGEQEILDFAVENVFITPAVKIFNKNESWVRSGITKIEQLLKVSHRTGKPKLFVFSNCVKTIQEFETYRWIESKQLATLAENDKEIPLKANDHCMDALRYFVVSHFAGTNIGDTIVTK